MVEDIIKEIQQILVDYCVHRPNSGRSADEDSSIFEYFLSNGHYCIEIYDDGDIIYMHSSNNTNIKSIITDITLEKLKIQLVEDLTIGRMNGYVYLFKKLFKENNIDIDPIEDISRTQENSVLYSYSNGINIHFTIEFFDNNLISGFIDKLGSEVEIITFKDFNEVKTKVIQWLKN